MTIQKILLLSMTLLTILFIQIPGAPDAPSIACTQITKNGFNVEWNEPQIYGGNEVGGYHVRFPLVISWLCILTTYFWLCFCRHIIFILKICFTGNISKPLMKLLVTLFDKLFALHYTKNEYFALRISSVNVTESPGNCGFGHIYWRNP